MYPDFDLFDPRRLARSSDPDTSHSAASEAEILRSRHFLAILKVLRQSGEEMTAEEIADCAGVPGMDKVAVGKRFSELIDQGLIERTARRKRNRSGRSASCHVAV